MAEENRKRGSRRNILLPDELQEEILRRLPAKAVTRFESVCKTWRSKFHSRSFINLYGRRRLLPYNNNLYTTQQLEDLFLHTTRLEDLLKIVPGLSPGKDPLKFHARNREWSNLYRVVGPTSNEIYCLTSHPTIGFHFCIAAGKIALCNPATHNYKFTNPFPDRIRARLDEITPKHCNLLHIGFGRCGGDDDYKVVVIANYGKSVSNFSSYVALVYSFHSGEWRKIVDYNKRQHRRGSGRRNEGFHTIAKRLQYITNSFEACPQRSLEGCWHWSAMGKYGPDHTLYHYVLSFSFADEAFKLIGAPWRNQEEHEVDTMGAVSVLHDHLAFIYLTRSMHIVAEVDVWMMMEYGVEDSWTRIFKTNTDYYGGLGFSRFLGIHSIYTPPRPRGDGDGKSGVVRVERLFFEDSTAKHQVISCDEAGHQVFRRDLSESGRWSHASIYRKKNFWNTYGISTYVETLDRL